VCQQRERHSKFLSYLTVFDKSTLGDAADVNSVIKFLSHTLHFYGRNLSVSPSVDMLPFGVTIPATVPQRSEIPEGLLNYPVLFNFATSCGLILKHISVNVYVCMYARVYVYIYVHMYMCVWADKSLARPGRKQATATKL
jgi:hypothetical protein